MIVYLDPGDDFQSMRLLVTIPPEGMIFQHPFGSGVAPASSARDRCWRPGSFPP
jgi:hypothetical protein